MTDQNSSPHVSALRELEAALEAHRRTQAVAGASTHAAAPDLAARFWGIRIPAWRLPFDPFFLFDRRHPFVRNATIAIAGVAALVLIGGGLLWWRLTSGPITLDVATPWLTSAIEQNLGSRYRVKVGGTQLERDAQGHTALRLRDIVLRDAAGTLVAVAPKAEVGLSGASFLVGNPRVESFRLVDASLTIRIDPDGQVNFIVGGEKPFAVIAPDQATTSPSQTPPTASIAAPSAVSPNASKNLFQEMATRSMATNIAALLVWSDRLGALGLEPGKAEASGFDGRGLTQIGIANASLTIDDRRDGYQWKLSEISVNLSRPRAGGMALTVVSDNQERPWSLNAALTPGAEGRRRLQFEAHKVLLDDLLALRMAESRIRSDTLVSASIDSDVAADGTPQTVSGSIVAQGGSIGDPADPEHQIPITSAEFGLDWDVARRTVRVPFKVTSGRARFTLRSEFAAPAQPGGAWIFALGGGSVVLDSATADGEGLILRRVVMRGNIDPAAQRITLEHGDIGTNDSAGVTVALSGKFDYGNDPHLALGIAGNPMPAGAFKRLWPSFVSPKVRDWVLEHIVSGTVNRLDIAANASLAAMQPGGPPMPEEGLSVDIVGSNVALRPVAGLPAITGADMNVHVDGRSAKITLGKGTVDVSPGRRLVLSNGLFEVPNTRMKTPPARVTFRVDGSVPAAAELLALDRLREFSGAPFDPATTKGAVSAQVALGMPLRPDLPPGSTEYDIAVDLSNFSADKMLLGQKIEAQALRVTATNLSYEIKGDAKVAGAPAQIEYRKLKGESDAEVKLQATLDEASRARLGVDAGAALTGLVPIKINGRIGTDDREARFNVEGDLTAAKIDNLLPGWVKPSGKPARLAFTMVKGSRGLRFDDLLVDGQGVVAKGTLEFDNSGELQAANFPVFATSDGDKVSLRADRGADGALRVMMRGDVFDGRNFVKSAMGGPTDPNLKARHPDLDLDVKLGVVAGHYGETVRGLEWRMSRRGGRVRTFSLNAKIGRDTPLIGELRTRANNGKPVIYLETNDAGALFRFTDLYSRMIGGRMWVGMDPPNQDGSPQEGIVNVSGFSVRGEGTLDQVVSGAPNGAKSDTIDFSQARADFTRSPGRVIIKDGVLRGPMIGATVEGNIDYVRDQVHVRGTLVPLYGLNNMFGQIPIVGLFLGGGNEGIFGITYEVGGTTGNPRAVVNPISAIAPGMLRKFFEFRDNGIERSFADPPIR
jgi:hypothetical protein